ncbi:MAG TPA: periplasmic heavy metal sensor [Desulfobaccales bacterium]
MKRNWLLYVVIFSLALNLGTIGTLVYLRYQDQAQGLSREISPPMPMRALWRDLKLDPSQRQALHALFPEHRDKVMEIRGELAQKRQELFNLLSDEAPALPAVQVKVREISGLQGKLEEELVRFLLEFKKHLKPEQSAAFLGLVQTRLDKTLGGFGPGGRHWHGRPGPGMGHGPAMGPPPGMEPPPGMGPGGPGRPD